MLNRDTLGFMLQASRSFGGVVSLDKRLFLVSHPESIQYILQDNVKNFRKNAGRGAEWGAHSLALSEDEAWEQQRRRLQAVFQRQHNEILVGHVLAATERMMERWDARESRGKPVDVEQEMVRLILDALVEMMFGSSLRGQAGELMESIDIVHRTVNRRAQASISLPPGFPTPANRRYGRALTFLRSFIDGAIAERHAGAQGEDDLLGMLVNARDPETGKVMDDGQLHDEVLMLLVLGHQTAAMALTWTWYNLSRFPDVEAQTCEEVRSILGGLPPAPGDVACLPYLRQVLEETLRLYPPTWMISRVVLADDELGGYDIPGGSLVVFGPWVTHRLADFWESPEEFEPGRFSPARSASRPRFAYFPFGGGPRRCIAGNFALMELPLIVSRVVQRFRLRLVDGDRIVPQPTLVLRPKKGLRMVLKRVPERS